MAIYASILITFGAAALKFAITAGFIIPVFVANYAFIFFGPLPVILKLLFRRAYIYISRFIVLKFIGIKVYVPVPLEYICLVTYGVTLFSTHFLRSSAL
jgi:hypothetical protein